MLNNQNQPERDRTNDITSGALHLIGVGLASAVLVMLLVLGAKRGDAWHIVGYSIYGAGLILLYLASASYHLVPHSQERLKAVLRKLDHAMIYILIAATYTPITFLALSGGWRWSIFGVIWGLAILGIFIKLLSWKISPAVSISLYIAMGWLITIAFSPLMNGINTATLWLLISGGVSYTLGAIFFALERVLPQRKYFWAHEIFHVFVLGGSTLHTIAMFFLL
ncbi:hemolysin III family protein [Candidatus Nomurabacteria bacterium]|nr:hemolysin III family protein [Candidatus Nomurabacteria bacterium]